MNTTVQLTQGREEAQKDVPRAIGLDEGWKFREVSGVSSASGTGGWSY